MSLARNIYAYTAPGADFPEFVSINVNADGGVVLTARAPKIFGGHVVDVHMPYEQLAQMLHLPREYARSSGRKRNIGLWKTNVGSRVDQHGTFAFRQLSSELHDALDEMMQWQS